jgi:hypothetical protein
MEHEARTARAKFVRGAPGRPKTSRAPVRRFTAVIQVRGCGAHPSGTTRRSALPMVTLVNIPSGSQADKMTSGR